MINCKDLINNELEESKQFYFDTYKDNNSVVELSTRNVYLAEAMFKNDSAYLKANDENGYPTKKCLKEITKEYKINYNYNNTELYDRCLSKGNYKGLSAFWFSELKKMNPHINNQSDDKYKFILAGAAQSVDRENSTHLNSDHQRCEIIGRLCEYTPSGLYNLILYPEEKFELITVISDKTNPKDEKFSPRSNFSFATKFCHYYSYYIFKGNCRDNYSIFDNVLKNALPLYLKHFNICLQEYYQEGMSSKINKIIKSNRYLDFLKYIGDSTYDDDELTKGKKYKIYLDIITNIIDKSEQKISRNGFDHLLWYYYKGREINDK